MHATPIGRHAILPIRTSLCTHHTSHWQPNTNMSNTQGPCSTSSGPNCTQTTITTLTQLCSCTLHQSDAMQSCRYAHHYVHITPAIGSQTPTCPTPKARARYLVHPTAPKPRSPLLHNCAHARYTNRTPCNLADTHITMYTSHQPLAAKHQHVQHPRPVLDI